MIRVATADDAPALAGALARAFFDDPVSAWALPSARRRAGRQRRFFGERLRTLLPEELVFCDEERRGAALWAPPDAWRKSLGELLRTRIVTWRAPLFLACGMRI